MTETGSPAAYEVVPPGRTRLGGYALCVDDAGRILLARLSAIEVDVGAWTLPGGGIDFGEHPDDAVIRELEEETGYRGEIESIAGVFSHVYRRSRAAEGQDLHFLGILYHVRVVGGGLRDEVGGTTDTARWFASDELASVRLVEIARFGIDLAFAARAAPTVS
ncbi:MAG TPA: NUDIX domain-containing protein [Candidatus Limnocylindrales bacterium]|nr:NUDIX domain-containing protein [Candidatus Limnocylindrales bacterium]